MGEEVVRDEAAGVGFGVGGGAGGGVYAGAAEVEREVCEGVVEGDARQEGGEGRVGQVVPQGTEVGVGFGGKFEAEGR